MLFAKLCFALLLILESWTNSNVEGVTLEVDLKLTDAQKEIMDKFQKLMAPKVPHKYMQHEIYLVRWLRARNFDIKKAEEMLLQNLKWRRQNKMDTIHNENWNDMKLEFPYFINGYDKRKQPILTAISRDWDLRQAVITGRLNRGLRYLDAGMDLATQRVRELQFAGQNVTQFVLILHMGNFNLYQHGCPRCITGILEFLDSYENHFPGMADQILLIQTPPAFETIAKLVREAASPATREALKIYGSDPKQWKKKLLDFIDADQLTEEFGGTRSAKD